MPPCLPLFIFSRNTLATAHGGAFALLALAFSCVDSAATGIVFTDVTAAAGLDTPHASATPTGAGVMTGGAAARDFDGDGWTDLIVTRIDANPILYKNQGDGTFIDVTAGSGISMPSGANGVAWGDVDNDGDPDLYITRADTTAGGVRSHQLYINDGSGVFTEEASVRNAGVGDPSDPRYGTSVAFGDYDNDGWLDLHVNEWGGSNFVGEEFSEARLLRNVGASAPGSFTDVTYSAGVEMDDDPGTGVVMPDLTGTWGFSSRFTDLDGDGHKDLVVAADFGTSHLFWNNGDGTFTDGTAAAGLGTDENGMGLAIGDYDGDGLQDIFITSIYHSDPENTGHNAGDNWGVSGNRLFKNNGDRTFADVTASAGVLNGSWGWGADFADYDNDGDLDLAMTNGWPDGDFASDQTRIFENNGDGTFSEMATVAGVTDNDSGKGLLSFDFDNDGDLDLMVVNNGLSPVLYRNDSTGDFSWLELKLEGTITNRDAVGTMITVIPAEGEPMMIREIDAGSNYLSQNDIVAHFGLGDWDTAIATVRIEWASGVVQEFSGVLPNQRLLVVETVPEPSRGLLAVVGLVSLAMRRRR